jgi:hypothetical protein
MVSTDYRARIVRARLAACRDAAESGDLAAAARIAQELDPNGDWVDSDYGPPSQAEILAALAGWELES